jgi:phosphoenolpyruvate synthase/pyruvate phosphate dikinase
LILPLSGRKLPPGAGNKAANLRFLLRAGFPVPESHVCTPEVCRACAGEDSPELARLRNELRAALKPDRSYAVRSSATVEDRPGSSYAGQFRTVLDARGVDSIVGAIADVCASASTRWWSRR